MRRPRPTIPTLLLALASLAPPLAACDGATEDEAVPLESGGRPADGEPEEAATALLAARAPRKPAVVRRLERATEGLLFSSESDAPFEVHHFPRPGGLPDAARIAALTGEDPSAPVEERTVRELFRGATTPLPEHGPAERAVVERYRALVALLERDLAHLRVFRFGAVEIHTYVVGVTKRGDWVALSTIQIET